MLRNRRTSGQQMNCFSRTLEREVEWEQKKIRVSITRPRRRRVNRCGRGAIVLLTRLVDGARTNEMDAHAYYGSDSSSSLPRVHLASRP